MSWMPFLTQLLQTISVGTIATALYAVAKWGKSILDHRPLLFGLVRLGRGMEWSALEIVVCNRSGTHLYVEAVALVGAGGHKMQTHDGGMRTEAVIDTVLAPHVQNGSETPTLTIEARLQDLDPKVKLVPIEITVVFARRWKPRRRYRLMAAVTDQRRNLSISI